MRAGSLTKIGFILGLGNELIVKRNTDVQEAAPTSDQLNSILEYLGPSKAGTVIKDATGSSDALRRFKTNEGSFQRPLVVDWNNGRAGMQFKKSHLSCSFSAI